MSGAADLISAIASLAWPLVAAFFLWIYRPEITGLLRRLRRLNLPGASGEFDSELDALDSKADAAAVSFPPALLMQAKHTEPTRGYWEAAGALGLAASGGSPKLALIALLDEIERAAAEVAAEIGHLYTPAGQGWTGMPLEERLRRLGMSEPLTAAIRDFMRTRNRIMRNPDATDDDVVRALDSGTKILAAVKSVPRERHIVRALAPLYNDPHGGNERDGVAGLVIDSTRVEGQVDRRVFPTTISTYYREGAAVAWEWDTGHVWPESWYRDPDSNEITYAFTESGEFIGKHLSDIYPPLGSLPPAPPRDTA